MKYYIILFVLFIANTCSYRYNRDKTSTAMIDTIKLNNGMSIPCEDITKETFEKLLEEQQGQLLETYNQRQEVYLLKNGEALVECDGFHFRYFKLSDFDAIYKEMNRGSGREILENQNPYGKDFPDHTLGLIDTLKKELAINYKGIDSPLLAIIDEKINALPNKKEFQKQHLLHAIAVVGEVFNKANKGKWKMMLAEDEETWNPYIETEIRDIYFFIDLYEEIFIREADYPILSSAFETTQIMARMNAGYRVKPDKQRSIHYEGYVNLDEQPPQ